MAVRDKEEIAQRQALKRFLSVKLEEYSLGQIQEEAENAERRSKRFVFRKVLLENLRLLLKMDLTLEEVSLRLRARLRLAQFMDAIPKEPF